MKKERVDVLVVKQELCESREQAKRAIMAGLVYDENNQRIDKPGEKIAEDKVLHLKGKGLAYVSRGGLKLEKALQVFDVSMTDKIVLDIGASTGGFTDVALQNGAKMSYALDVGYNQLSWKLRQDARVIVMERTNFRYCQPADFTHGLPEVATIDVSFISLRLILPVLQTILVVGGDVVALVKPQFEAGKEFVGKNGVIRDAKVHQQVLSDMLYFMSDTGFYVCDVSFSPITGGEGNIEFLVHLKLTDEVNEHLQLTRLAEQVVKQAQQELGGKKR